MAEVLLTIERLIEETNDLPVMPAPVLRVMHLAGEPTSSASQLAEAICAEPSLAARVMRFANSAYYGMSGQVSTVQGAVVLLGIKTVRNLAMVAASHVWFSGQDSDDNEAARGLWDHAIGVAAAADALATLRAPELANEAFCSGLLHDIGKTVLSIRLGETMNLMASRAAEQDMPLHEAEKATFGFDHTEVGLALAEKWNLPERLRAAIRWHHEPNAAGETQKLVDMVHVADVLYWRSLAPEMSEAPVHECADAFSRMCMENVETYEQLVSVMLQHQQQLERLMDAA